MKNMRTIGRIISAVLVLALLSGLLTACNGNGRGDRETTFTGETKNTVNPNISEPNQSIASGAMIPETTTSETTTEVKNGGTYTINGVEFTISHPIEHYLYTLPGHDSKYIDLDKFIFQADGTYNGMVRQGSFVATDVEGENVMEGSYKCDNSTLRMESGRQVIVAQVVAFSDDMIQLRYVNETYHVTISLTLRKL